MSCYIPIGFLAPNRAELGLASTRLHSGGQTKMIVYDSQHVLAVLPHCLQAPVV